MCFPLNILWNIQTWCWRSCYFTVLAVSCSSVNSNVIRSWCNDWIFQHPWQMLLIDHSCSVNGFFWQSFFPNVLKTVLCSGHGTECLVFCCGLQISMSVQRANTTAGRTRCVWTHPAHLCVSVTPATSVLMITPAQVSSTENIIMLLFFVCVFWFFFFARDILYN